MTSRRAATPRINIHDDTARPHLHAYWLHHRRLQLLTTGYYFAWRRTLKTSKRRRNVSRLHCIFTEQQQIYLARYMLSLVRLSVRHAGGSVKHG